MNRAELHKLASERIADAKALLAMKRWSGAYYLAGYAVECGLKACVIVRLQGSDDFPERRFSEQCWTHNLIQLLALANLQAPLAIDAASDPVLEDNWETVKDWNEASRYLVTNRTKAESLYKAITDKKAGILPWIKLRW